MSEFVRRSEHTARKERRCDACEQMIEKGTRYSLYVWKTEGYLMHLDYHPDCRAHEVELNHAQGNWGDDWRGLQSIVEEDGPHVLDSAPESVRARFAKYLRDDR